MTDDAAFIAAICANPQDDLPRKVYADWLDEHDQPERAEFIRVQCRLAELAEEVVALSIYGNARVDLSALRLWKGQPLTPEQRARCEEALALMRRALELYPTRWGAWAGGLPEWLVEKACPACVDQAPDYETNVVECRRCDSTGRVPCDDLIGFRRGFVAELDLTWPQARDRLDAIRKAHPIEKVTLTHEPDVGWRPVDREATVQGLWLVNAAGEPIGEEMEFGHDENPYPALLAAWQPGVEWKLSSANQYAGWRHYPNESGGVDRVRVEQAPSHRDEIEAAVRRLGAVGERVMWTRDEAEPGVHPDVFHHVCVDDPDSLKPEAVHRQLTVDRARLTREGRSLLIDVPRFAGEERQEWHVYTAWCPNCETIFLAESR